MVNRTWFEFNLCFMAISYCAICMNSNYRWIRRNSKLCIGQSYVSDITNSMKSEVAFKYFDNL